MGMTDSEAIKKKITNAKPTSWLTDGLTQEEIEEALTEGNKRSKERSGSAKMKQQGEQK